MNGKRVQSNMVSTRPLYQYRFTPFILQMSCESIYLNTFSIWYLWLTRTNKRPKNKYFRKIILYNCLLSAFYIHVFVLRWPFWKLWNRLKLYPSIHLYTGIKMNLLHFTLLHFTLLHFTSLYFTLLYFTLLYFTLLHFTSLYFTLYWIIEAFLAYCSVLRLIMICFFRLLNPEFGYVWVLLLKK